ncbi:zinc finger protein 488 [Aplochiton taeniatus]
MKKVETLESNIQFKLLWSTEARNAQQWIADMFTRVHTNYEIPVNAIFGPCELKHTSVYDSIAFIALKATDKRTAPYVLRVDTSTRTGATGPTWLRTVQSARCAGEQNLEAYVKNGELFYRSVKTIERGEELLVWYGGDLAKLLHLEVLKADKDQRFNALLLKYHTEVLRNRMSAAENRNLQSETLFEVGQSVGLPSSSNLQPTPLVLKPKATKRAPVVQPLSPTMHGQKNLFYSLAANWSRKTPSTSLSLPKSQRQIHSLPLPSSVSSPGLLRLPSSLSPLSPLRLPAQNWCAKCNVSFRLTSELVHHMRSHHTGAPCGDPGVKSSDKEERYRCTVCTEVFKQRHHLARHLAAHT